MEKSKVIAFIVSFLFTGFVFSQNMTQQQQLQYQQQAIQNSQQQQQKQQQQQGIKGLVYGPNGLCDQYRAQQQGEAVNPGMKTEGQWHQLHGADTPLSLKTYGATMNVICPQPQQQQQPQNPQQQQQMQLHQQAQQSVQMIQNINQQQFGQQMQLQQNQQQNQNRP